VVEAESPTPRRRLGSGSCLETKKCGVAVVRAQRHSRPIARDDAKSDDTLVVLERTVQITYEEMR
jgi:hypothetical protein